MGKNWNWSRQRGKEQRLKAEYDAAYHGGSVPTQPPLHSHDATMQSHFNKGWYRVNQHEINVHTGKAPPIPKGSGLAKLRSIKQCHF